MNQVNLRLALIHGLVGFVYFTGVSHTALWVCGLSFLWRTIFLSVSYHRYFSHRAFETGRAFQCFLAVAGSICMQKGALWWASTHRKHHQYTDTHRDPHSPVAHGFWYAHIGWALHKDSLQTDYSKVKDFARFPELVWLNEKSDWVHALYALGLVMTGEVLRYTRPELGTSGPQLLLWGYLISGLMHLHTIFLVNSLGHLKGARPYTEVESSEAEDNSRNIWWLALLTAGEGWHNNHHAYPTSSKLSLHWWQFDLGWLVIRAFEALGLVRRVRVANPGRSPELAKS